MSKTTLTWIRAIDAVKKRMMYSFMIGINVKNDPSSEEKKLVQQHLEVTSRSETNREIFLEAGAEKMRTQN